jgi:hypothetical protein
MKDNQPSKKKRFVKTIGIFSIISALIMSSFALYNTMDNLDLSSGESGDSSLSRIGPLYGTNGCEDGGFSIQIGIDSNQNNILEDEEVSEIRNLCHGTQGESGPMGNRGYQGYNGTDGINGSNGTDGIVGESAFIESFTGAHGPCSDSVIIEMGNNSTSKAVDSSIKICFQNLTSGRLTDIQQNSGDSFSTPCQGGFASGEIFVFAAVQIDKCLLFTIQDDQLNLLSPNVDFSPGANLGFTEHGGRIWFDATDEMGVELWSTNGISIWKETNLSFDISDDDSLIKVGEEIVLTHSNGMLIFGESEVIIDGIYTNTTSAGGTLLYNTPSGISIGGAVVAGEIQSSAIFHEGYYWFIATSDGNGAQLHRSDGTILERMTSTLQGLPGQTISPTVIGNSILFDSGGLFAFNTSSSSLFQLNSSLQDVGDTAGSIVFDGNLWFDCGVPSAGYELCSSNGEDAWLHSDHIAGMASSNPSHLAIVGENLVTIITDPMDGGQLHLVAENGLIQLWDHDDGNLAAGVHGDIWVDEEMVYYVADSATYGLELYGWAHGELSEDWIIIH